MQYKEIVSVTGLGGLFHLLATKSDGAIVRSLADNVTKFIPSRLHNVTPLESIEIYTTGNNVRLHEVLQKMMDSSVERPDSKKASNEAIRAYFKEVYPDMDEDRVYSSDMKKMLKWYEVLNKSGLLDFSGMISGAQDEEKSEEAGEAVASEGPASADAEVAEKSAKKSKAKKEEEPADASEKPAKKAAAKKTVAEDAGIEGATAKKSAKPKKKEAE